VRNPSLVGGLVLVAMVLGGCAKEAPYGTASQEAIRAYDKGMDDFGKFYYADALKAFEQATQADSGFAIAWARIAQIYFRTDNRGEASSAIARAIEYSDRATPREGLYIRLLSHFVSYEFDSAAATADTLIREYPEDKEAYLQRGYLFEYDRNYERAIQMYQRAADLDTGCAQAYMSLGYAYSSIGEQEKALAYMKRYIRLAPQAGDPRASYADLLVRVGRYKEALDQYQKSLEIKPDYWYSMLQIARVYATMGKLRESDVYMQKAINLLPPTVNREVMTLTTHAGYDMNRGKYQEAADQYISALTIDSLNGSAAYGYCGALVRLHRPKEAREVLSRILAVLERRNLLGSAAMLDYYLMRSRIAVAEENLQAAQADCDTALSHATLLMRPYVYRQIAEIDLRSKDFESALTACEEALALNPNEPLMLLTLTRVYQAMGDARMTREIGSRLSAFWADADSDFVRLKELRRILGRVAAA
jgi:tetratricopeptide (TPR) repeat protein